MLQCILLSLVTVMVLINIFYNANCMGVIVKKICFISICSVNVLILLMSFQHPSHKNYFKEGPIIQSPPFELPYQQQISLCWPSDLFSRGCAFEPRPFHFGSFYSIILFFLQVLDVIRCVSPWVESKMFAHASKGPSSIKRWCKSFSTWQSAPTRSVTKCQGKTDKQEGWE